MLIIYVIFYNWNSILLYHTIVFLCRTNISLKICWSEYKEGKCKIMFGSTQYFWKLWFIRNVKMTKVYNKIWIKTMHEKPVKSWLGQSQRQTGRQAVPMVRLFWIIGIRFVEEIWWEYLVVLHICYLWWFECDCSRVCTQGLILWCILFHRASNYHYDPM